MFEIIGGKVVAGSVAVMAAAFQYVTDCNGVQSRDVKGVELTVKGPDTVKRGQRVTFSVESPSLGADNACPEVANWYFDETGEKIPGTSISVRNLPTVKKPDGTCVVSASVSHQFVDPFSPNGPGDGQASVQLAAEGGLHIAEGSKIVKIEPAATPPPEKGPGGSVTIPPVKGGEAQHELVRFSETQYPVGQHLVEVDTGQFHAASAGQDVLALDDHDSAPDEKLVVLPSRGDGTFGTPIPTALSGPLDPAAMATGDFNGDGRPDVAVTSMTNENVVVFTGNADGTFTRVFVADPGYLGVPQPVDIAARNVVGDAQTDLVVASATGVIYVFSGDGDGTFTNNDSFSSGGSSPATLAIGQIDGAAGPDLVVGHSGDDAITVLRGSLTSGFDTPPVRVNGGADGNLVLGLGLGALRTSSSLVDIVASHHLKKRITRLLNTSTPGAPSFSEQIQPANPTGDGPNEVLINDLSKDGRRDVAVSNYASSTVSVLLGNGEGGLSNPEDIPTVAGPNALASHDLDGDAVSDLVVGGYDDGRVGVLINQHGKLGRSGAVARAASAQNRVPARLRKGQYAMSVRTAVFEPLRATSTSFKPDGSGVLRGLTVRGRLGLRITSSTKGLPRGTREVLGTTFAGKVDATRAFAPPANPITMSGVLVGRSNKDRRTMACLRVVARTRGGQTTHAFRLIGATGKARRLNLAGSGLPALSIDQPAPGSGRFVLQAKTRSKAKALKMPATCRAIARQLPRR